MLFATVKHFKYGYPHSNAHVNFFLNMLCFKLVVKKAKTIYTLKSVLISGDKYFNIVLVLQDVRLTIFTCPANTMSCTFPLKVYAIKNIRE